MNGKYKYSSHTLLHILGLKLVVDQMRLGGTYPGLGELVPRPVDGVDLVHLLLLLLSAAKAGGLLVHVRPPLEPFIGPQRAY